LDRLTWVSVIVSGLGKGAGNPIVLLLLFKGVVGAGATVCRGTARVARAAANPSGA
jgi:hypothetical protein